MTTASRVSDSRDAFEKWIDESGFDLTRGEDRDYAKETTDAAWGGWQAALACQGPGEGWRPIETAPEGVPCIVGWIDEGDECVEFDTLDEGVWQMHYGGWENFMSAAPAGSRGPSEKAPYTHWMPLHPVPTNDLTAIISKAEKV